MARNRVHERYPCPACGSKRTRFRGMSGASIPKPRHSCEDCNKVWTLGSMGKGGDRVSDDFHNRVVNPVAVPKRAKDKPFGDTRRIGGLSFTLLKVISGPSNPDKAWDEARQFRASISSEYENSRVVAAYDKENNHTGNYAVYVRAKKKEKAK